MSTGEERARWGAGWAGASTKLRYLLRAKLGHIQAQRRIEERLGGEHLPCLRGREALLREIAEEMGLNLGEEQAGDGIR